MTSPPYNLNVAYRSYSDDLTDTRYLEWTDQWISEVARVLRKDGSFFLNVAGSLSRPHLPFSVLSVATRHFRLQNQIVWVKSIHVPEAVHIDDVRKALRQKAVEQLCAVDPGRTFGHFKPVNSERFLNNTHEFVFHLTHDGHRALDRLAVGVPYADVTNCDRWKTTKTTRCAGNVWMIPYDTRQAGSDHPATFPVALPERCIRLHGIESDGVVLDPFGGSGTTSVAAKKLGVNSICVEMDEEYCRLAADRISGG